MARTSKILLLIVAVEVLATLIAVVTNVATGALPDAWHPYLWLAWPVLVVLVIVGLLVAVQLHRAGEQSGTRTAAISRERADYSRTQMLKQVRELWIENVLDHSLYHQTTVELGLERRPDMLTRPWDVVIERPDQEPSPLVPGTTAAQVLDEHRALLILGAPGAGKTTMLLDLTRDLLASAKADAALPIPVVFPLASWASSRKPLADWLVDELTGKLYGVPRDLAEAWITDERVLPLLDGLDEVALEQRAPCAKAIDDFHATHRLLPLVVCSRVADYQALGIRLRLPVALLIQPLTRLQIERYLDRLGEPLAGVLEALHSDPTLWELLQTPLLLSVTVRAYQGLPAAEVATGGSLDERRTRLFAAFVERALRRTAAQELFDTQKVVRWLSYIARGLGRRLETVFYLDFVARDWLPTRTQRRLVAWTTALPAGLLIGGLSGLLTGLLFGQPVGLAVGLAYGTVFTIALGSGSEGAKVPSVPVTDRAGQLTHALRSLLTLDVLALAGCGLGILGGLVGLLTGTVLGIVTSASFLHALAGGSLIGVVAGALLGLLLSMFEASSEHAGLHHRPADLRPGGEVGTAGWLTAGLSVVIGLPIAAALGAGIGPVGLLVGVLAGLTVGYVASGRAFLNHWLVRLLLARTGLAPAHYVAFLNFAATRILLHKVGSGYIFYHRLLLEYFARLELEEVPERYRRGALPAVDLRPEKLLEQALVRAPNEPDGALQALRYAADQLQPEQFAPTALKVAKLLEESLKTQRQDPFVGSSVEIYALIAAAKGAYLLVADSGHPDLAPAAAFYCGELLTRIALIDAEMHWGDLHWSSYQDGWKREARAAYRRAVQSQHPIHAGIAASRLVELDADQAPRPGNSSAPPAASH